MIVGADNELLGAAEESRVWHSSSTKVPTTQKTKDSTTQTDRREPADTASKISRKASCS